MVKKAATQKKIKLSWMLRTLPPVNNFRQIY